MKSYYDEENDEFLEFDDDWFAEARPMREIPELAGFLELRRKMAPFDHGPPRDPLMPHSSRSKMHGSRTKWHPRAP